MTEILRPDTPEQILEAVQWALAGEHAFDIVGRGSKKAYGCPMQTTHGLDLSALSGIDLYEPGELVMTAKAATPMKEIQEVLEEKHQRLAFEPADLGPLFGGEENAGSIGGVFACNLAGPRRIQAGSARDHILGFHAISGRGQEFKSGGRVVKNVTGFDLSKLMAGSFGTLALMSDVTFKVLPEPEKTRTVLISGASDEDAVKAMSKALQSPYEVSGAAHLPKTISSASDVSYVAGAGKAVTAIRVEGPGPSVAYRCKELRELLAGFGDIEELHTTNTRTLWREIRDVLYFADNDERHDDQVWRLSVPPASGAAVVSKLRERIDGRVFYDWGGGLIWLTMPARADAAHNDVREVVSETGGHATLIRADQDIRSQVPVFHPQPSALAELGKRVKNSFDPKGLFNPGRMA